VAKAEHRVEECLERAKGEAGLADYQVRNWMAWHHHQTLALLAAWFLTQETRRGKNRNSCTDLTAPQAIDRRNDRGVAPRQQTRRAGPMHNALVGAERGGPLLSPSLS
jgi:hypothetical protein